jgi:anti-sigma regulatory factor (Ser/Thr protein kinase)
MVGKVVSNIFGAGGSAKIGGIAYLELQLKPDISLVTVARRFIAKLYGRLLTDPADTSRLALATHELLENAARYAKDETLIRIEVDLDRRPGLVTIVMRNRAEPVNIAAIREVLDGVASAPDAFSFYQQLLVRRSKVRPSPGGLGLARICAEGDMKITYRIVDNDISVIEATASLGERALHE